MQIDDKDVKKIAVGVLVAILAILVFFLIEPVLLSIVGGLILAYIFTPTFRWAAAWIKEPTVNALVVSGVILTIITLPLWFIMPVMLQQVFDLYTFFQKASLSSFINTLFPTASEQFIAQISISVNSFISEIVANLLSTLNKVFLELPTISLHLFIIFFVFFFALRDGERLREFASQLSPFSRAHERILVQQFKDITDSVVYGQLIVGLVQGGLAGIGFLLFGVKNALVLTVLAIFLSILPIVGPFILWVPIGIFMLATGETGKGIWFILYNAIIVSLVDNFLRTYLISRKTDISPAVILVAMVGGFFFLGVVGLLLGPLIVSYFLTFLKTYRDRTFYDLIADKEHHHEKKQ
jgi:predicted PurR-regulated permease PerM